MNLLDLAVRIGVDDQASSQIEGLTTSMIAKATVIGNAFYDAAKFVGSKAVDMGKAIVGGAYDGYSAYEQLAGGVKKLYGDSADIIKDYAQGAYRTAGMSANQYMEQATGFSASLIKSLGGDTQEAARLTDVAMRAMSDNVNVFGSDMESVQNAFQGFAKENYTMLDNLKLGYAGTKAGAEQLVKDAAAMTKAQEKLGLTVDGNSLSFDNLVKAIAVVEQEQNIWGTTTMEAMGTIEGSVNMAKASWDNLLTAFGSGNTELIAQSVDGLVDSIFGEFSDAVGRREGGLISNVVPLVQRTAQAVIDTIPDLADSIVWNAIESINTLFGTNFNGEEIMYSIETAFSTAGERIGEVFDAISEAFDNFASTVDTGYLNVAIEKLGDIGEQVWGFVEGNIIPNLPTLGTILGDVANFLLDVADTALTVLDNLGPLVPVISGAIGALMLMKPVIGIFSAVSGAFKVLTTVIVPALGMVQSFGGAISLVTTLLGGPIPILIAVGGAIAAFIATNDDAKQAILDAWEAVVGFFEGLPEFFSGVWSSVVSSVTAFVGDTAQKWNEMMRTASQIWEAIKSAVTEKVTQLVTNAVNKFNEMKTNVVNKVTELKNNAVNRFNEVKTSISTAINGAKNTVTNAVSGMYDSVKAKFDSIVAFVRGIPSRIVSALGNVGSILWNAGSSIISGLKDGMVSAFNSVKNWVSGIADTIASLKGPLPYDRRVLIENGVELMSGLQRGLERGFESMVVPYVSDMATGIQSAFGSPTLSVATAGAQQGGVVYNLHIDGTKLADRQLEEALGTVANRVYSMRRMGAIA